MNTQSQQLSTIHLMDMFLVAENIKMEKQLNCAPLHTVDMSLLRGAMEQQPIQRL